MTGRFRSVAVAVGLAGLLAGCSSDPAPVDPSGDEPAVSAEGRTVYDDPAGRFKVSLPTPVNQPRTTRTTDGQITTVLQATPVSGSETVRVVSAPATFPLAELSASVNDVALARAKVHNGTVSDERPIMIVGEAGRRFTVSQGDETFEGAAVVIGATRFEFEVAGGAESLDALVSTLQLVHAVSKEPGHFFEETERRCDAANQADAKFAEDPEADPMEQISEQISRRESDIAALRGTPANAVELADAVSYLEALDRSVVAQRQFLVALQTHDPNLSTLSRQLGSDLSFAADRASEHKATSCS